MKHFVRHVHPTKEDPILLIVDEHVSHENPHVLEFAKQQEIILLCLPPLLYSQTSTTRYFILRPAWNVPKITQSSSDWRLNFSPGGKGTQLVVARLFEEICGKATMFANATSGFSSTGIWPVNFQKTYSSHPRSWICTLKLGTRHWTGKSKFWRVWWLACWIEIFSGWCGTRAWNRTNTRSEQLAE